MFIQTRYTVGLLLLLFVSMVLAEVVVPNLSRRVTDLTATLNAGQITALETKLADFETKKGSQIAVLILPSTQSETIEAFSIRVAEAWKIGRKNIDDGVILIVAKEDRKLRLEVGRGLEGVIPDAIAKRVLAETIKPYFKANDYAGGIDAGVTQLIGLIQGETLPVPSPTTTSTQIDKDFDSLVIILFFCCIVIDLLFSSIFGSVIGTILASMSGVIAASFLALDIWQPIIIGMVIFFFLKIAYRFGSTSSDSSWDSSRSSSSWSSDSSSSSSSSDWGGGGGDFGGGGASDSW